VFETESKRKSERLKVPSARSLLFHTGTCGAIRKVKLTEQLRLFLPLSPLDFCQSPIPSPNETQSRPRPVFNPVFQQNLPTADVRGNDD
jgi:hypothetical protein